MSTDPDTILLEAEEHMQKAISYLSEELKGIRAGRASPAMVEFIKVEFVQLRDITPCEIEGNRGSHKPKC